MINSSKIYEMGNNKIYANDEISFSVDTSGQVIIDGQDISKYDSLELTKFRRYSVGFVFQFYNLIPNLTVKENVELASEIVEDAIDAEEIVTKVGLKERLDNFPAQLSGGEQQKKPKLLLCDEPTGALDYQTGKSILKLLKETAESTNTTVILITHNSAITPIGDKVIEIRDAKVKSITTNDNPKSIDDIEW